MRLATPARVRAVGMLLLEAASLGLLLAQRFSKDEELRDAVTGFFKKARAL